MDFASKVAVVTGASSGIGQSLAVKLQERGARVVLAARNAARLESLAQELRQRGHDNLVCATDVTREDQLDRLVAQTVERYRTIDILVNNAGAGHYARIVDGDMAEIRRTFELNFFAPVSLILKAWPVMARSGGGHVVNISSTAGFRSWPGNGYYCAAKHALNAVTESLLLEAGDDGLRPLLVMPGTTNTEFIANSVHVSDELLAHPPRDMTPDAVAEEILRALAGGQKRLVLTTKGKIIHYLNRLSPALVDHLLQRSLPAPEAAADGAASGEGR